MYNIIIYVFPFMDLKDITSCMLLNKQFNGVIKNLFYKKKKDSIKCVEESVNLFYSFHNSKHFDILATLCFELLQNHCFFLKMNWKNFTKDIISSINQKIRFQLPNENPFYKELLFYRNNLILLIPHQIDLYMYNKGELIDILKIKSGKSCHSKNKHNIILMIKS